MKNFLSVCLALLIGFGGGVCFNRYISYYSDAEVVETSSEEFDLQLPGEVEKRIITVDEIEGKLEQLNEWSTYSAEYQVTKSADYIRYLLDDIPMGFTTNTVSLECTVVVKVGYNVDDIDIQIDDESNKVYLSLPDLTVTNHYIIWDTVICDEQNNIFNPIDFEQYQTLFADIEADALTQAEDEGIYDAAKENAQQLIDLALAEFSDYEVVFM